MKSLQVEQITLKLKLKTLKIKCLNKIQIENLKINKINFKSETKKSEVCNNLKK